MKRVLTAAISLMLFAASYTNTNPSELFNLTQNKDVMETTDNKSIENLLGTYKTSLNTSDAKLAQSLYAENGIFMPSGAPSAVGSDNILKSYEFIFSQIQLNIEFSIEEIVVDGNIAFATTSSKGTTLIHATGETIPEENRELFVFENVEGAWKIARYMFNKTK